MLTDVNTLAAFLYLRQGEQMPDFSYTASRDASDEELAELELQRCAAEEAWFSQPDPFAVDLDRLGQFISATEGLLANLANLELDLDEPVQPQYMTLFYDAAKVTFDYDKTQLRQYFEWLYLVLFQTPAGPRWGEFVDVYGVENFNDMVRERFANLVTTA